DHDNYFTSLPREYYLDDGRYTDELAKVWGQQWIYAGHVSQIPKSGDYFTFEVGTENILLVRDGADVRAVHNVCRHRGLQLCNQPTGRVGRRIVCPYHSWSYGLDGKLLKATRQADGEFFDYKDFSLFPIHVSVWQGFIF